MIKNDPELIREMIRKGRRIDNRKNDEYRSAVIEPGIVSSAEGSARVKLGNTEIVAGVKMDIGEPFPDKQEEGVLMVSAELSPLASPNFETGPPREDSIELARVVARGIRESKTIETDKLCIEKGEKVWMVFVDLQIINHGGNLLDACALAASAALQNAKMPEYDGEKLNHEKKKKNLPVNEKPIPVTLAQLNDKLVVDPAMEEEDVMSSRITIVTKENGNICAVQKGGKSGFSMEGIEEAIDISMKRGKEIRKML